VNPLLAPPLLVFRALEDIHTLAQTAPRFVELGERIADLGERMLDLGERIDARGDQIIEMGNQFEALGDVMTAEVRATQAAASDVVSAAREILTALPILEQAVALGAPLEGAVERIGRIVDRLPGGRRGPVE
jgi:hypothetical protein